MKELRANISPQISAIGEMETALEENYYLKNVFQQQWLFL